MEARADEGNPLRHLAGVHFAVAQVDAAVAVAVAAVGDEASLVEEDQRVARAGREDLQPGTIGEARGKQLRGARFKARGVRDDFKAFGCLLDGLTHDTGDRVLREFGFEFRTHLGGVLVEEHGSVT